MVAAVAEDPADVAVRAVAAVAVARVVVVVAAAVVAEGVVARADRGVKVEGVTPSVVIAVEIRRGAMVAPS